MPKDTRGKAWRTDHDRLKDECQHCAIVYFSVPDGEDPEKALEDVLCEALENGNITEYAFDIQKDERRGEL